jgi:hypothetical protein
VYVEGKEAPWHVLGKAMNCAVYLINRSISKSTGSKTAYELWTGEKPSVNHLRTFGCIARSCEGDKTKSVQAG